MFRFFFNFLCFIFSCFSVFGQIKNSSSSNPHWEKIHVKNTGGFYLPPSMEVQKGKYREYFDDFKKIKGYETTQLTAQQRGLNSFDSKGFERYARILLETKYGNEGDFEELYFNLNKYTNSDISKLDSFFKNQILNTFKVSRFELISWKPLELKVVNGMSCFHLSYVRQFLNQPLVLVNIYYFHNSSRIHAFTLSYRLSESNYWKSDFIKVLQSFKLET